MRKKLGVVCMVLGFAMMLCAAGLLMFNEQQDDQAGKMVQQVLPQLRQQIPPRPDPERMIHQMTPEEFLEHEAFEMTEVEIDGYGYIGYLSIPALELELPVMADWDDTRLQIAPCRYHGSTNGEDLVLMAHNYRRHFGRLTRLEPGDSVIFTDMDGITTHYLVAAKDVLAATAVEEMVAGEFPLTLFTCNYGGGSRVTIFCDKE